MSSKQKIARRHTQVKQIKRDMVINIPIIIACLALTICAYWYNWHIVLKVFLSFVSFMQLMHLPNLFTRLSDQKKKLVEIESKLEG